MDDEKNEEDDVGQDGQRKRWRIAVDDDRHVIGPAGIGPVGVDIAVAWHVCVLDCCLTSLPKKILAITYFWFLNSWLPLLLALEWRDSKRSLERLERWDRSSLLCLVKKQ